MNDIFAKMRRELDEEANRQYLWGKAHNYYKHFQNEGYRGRFLPRHSNLPLSLRPTIWDCRHCFSGNCRLSIMQQHLCMLGGAFVCKYVPTVLDPQTSPLLCPCFCENDQYRRKVDNYHISAGHPEFVRK